MKTLKQEWLIWLIILIPYLFVAVFWNDFPDRIPTHFNIHGEPDDYSSKITGLILLPGINLVLYFLLLFLPKIDPSRKNYELFRSAFKIIRIALHSFLSLVLIITAFYSLGHALNMTFIVLSSICLLFLIIGNYMGTMRHNYFVGIRTPWTLANETVWTRTHRLAGKIWVFASLIMLILLLLLPSQIMTLVFIAYVALITVWPLIYSYLIFRKTVKN